MPGIYVHIPFCRQACHYCDFHFSTSLANKDRFQEALKKEISLRKNYLPDTSQKIQTIYFGGGTPSLLSTDEWNIIFEELQSNFEIATDAEITLEANPDDLTKEKVRELSSTPINRLSIGIQSFFEEDLRWMNRAHTAQQAEASVKAVQDKGFENITIDLIYGVPTLSPEKWKTNLQKAFELRVPHISSYCLTIEPKTALADMVKKQKVKGVDELQGIAHFNIMLEEMRTHDFIQYEISNFCRDGFYSKHNSNYWKGEPYIGFGPSAHSFDGSSRQWNVANNAQYIRSLEENKLQFEREELTMDQRYNEYVMTSLRTMWGSNLEHIHGAFGSNYEKHFLEEAKPYLTSGDLIRIENSLFLTDKGKLLADAIASDLFITRSN
jgi:oxygen-independent coproporphyrinogen-3 oxidase